MTQLLRLFIVGDWPSQDAGCEWVLVDAAGKQLQRGRSEPRHWPAADECEIVLGAEQCLLLRATLPKGAKARLPEVVSYALEDQLIGDAEADHFVAGDSDTNGSSAVWVVARARLRVLLAALTSVDRRPRRACCEIQLAPLLPGTWSICLREQAGPPDGAELVVVGFGRTGPEDGFTFVDGGGPSSVAPPLEVQLALQAARASGNAPQSLAIYGVPGTAEAAAAALAASWQAELALPVKYAGDYVWHERSDAARTARNLLTNEFAPPRRSQEGWGSFRPALYLALATGALFALFSLGEWAWLTRQRDQLQQQMASTFRNAFPQSQALVNPPLQMQRLYDQMRREQGQLGSTDFLPLLGVATESMAGLGVLNRLGYEDGRLEVSLTLPKAKTAERIVEITKSRGLTVTLHDARPAKSGAEGVDATYSVRGTP